MTKRATFIVFLLLFAPAGQLLAAEGPAQRCALLLDRADASKDRGGHMEEALALYRSAFGQCAGKELPLDLDARLTARRGAHLLFYGNDRDGAIEVYEAGLERVTEAGGWAHPGRIPLLDGFAHGLAAKALRDDAERPEWLHTRALELYEEALRVRREVYGAESPQVASGLLKLGALQVEERPDVGETLAREALRINREHHGLHHPSVYEALVLLQDALRRRGKAGEVAETQDLIDRVLEGILDPAQRGP